MVLSIPVPEGVSSPSPVGPTSASSASPAKTAPVPAAAADSITATSPSPKSPAPAPADTVASPVPAAAAPGSATNKNAAPVPAAAEIVAAPGSTADKVAALASAADKPAAPAVAIVADPALSNDGPLTKEIVLYNSAEDYTVQGVIEYHLEKGDIRKEDIKLLPGQRQTIILKNDVNNVTYKVVTAPKSGLPTTDLIKGESAEVPKRSFKICQKFDGTAAKPKVDVVDDCNKTLQPEKKD